MKKRKSALDELKSCGQNMHHILNVHQKNCSLEKKKEKYGTKTIKTRLYNDQLQGNQPNERRFGDQSILMQGTYCYI